MRVLGWLLTGCIVVAALQAASAVLVLTVLAGIVVGLIVRPKETLALVAILMLTGIAQDRPATLIAIVGLVVTGCLIGKAIENARGP